ncbi:MAG: PSD1 domain-containing protein [Lewinella sp.]|nr:PSD1 domain-containing protein [Lewinella sp.]
MVEGDEVSFNHDIRPILNKHCLSCHGGVRQMGGFSLLFEEDAYNATESGSLAIVPGKHRKSEMFRRLINPDPEMRMPPEAPPLQQHEIDLIAKWIDQGAKWEKHWAYIPPDTSLQVPESGEWGNNEIDAFVWQKLQANGLTPEPEADAPDLLRRLSLDLIGLPPSEKLQKAFLEDQSMTYEQVVDSLLASPHYGERWAAMWLDLARYGDSQGYQKDKLRRNIWRYRDWVIDAFNRDLPFDEFTVDQLAGDLLPEPEKNEILATAFHRNTNTNDEGGTDDEEFRVVAVIDRLNTTFEIWQGVTMGCVQCHSHPYDPFLHREFYEGMAFFNNTLDHDLSNEFPRMSLLSPEQKRNKDRLGKWIKEKRAEADTISEAFKAKLVAWTDIREGDVPVMADLLPDSSRVTRVFDRGNWLALTDTVQPDVPKILPPLQRDSLVNRLDLAQWLVDSRNPLTGRVIVNRFWGQIFGQGIVVTVEDFGSQGTPPSHPQLLDWLALRLMHDHEWHLKPFLKDIVMSATYRQSSNIPKEKLAKDPYNALLSRGPRVRLSSEQLRDQALTIAGLLSDKMYGPSVMPYQPDGVWDVIRQVARWETSPGEDRYRRAVYTLIRKTSPYPSHLSFDGTSREFCVSRRIRTNTPLQAMITLNDPVYTEAAQVLADSMAAAAPEVEAQISYGYHRALLKAPDDYRLNELKTFYDEALLHYQQHPEQSTALLQEETASPQLAALTNVAGIILNLDELINK